MWLRSLGQSIQDDSRHLNNFGPHDVQDFTEGAQKLLGFHSKPREMLYISLVVWHWDGTQGTDHIFPNAIVELANDNTE